MNFEELFVKHANKIAAAAFVLFVLGCVLYKVWF